jgi:hypothetical protein
MKIAGRLLVSFISFFLALVGAISIARGLEVAKGPLLAGATSGWTVYHLDLSDTFLFYLGITVLAASLTSLSSQRCKPN